MPKFTCFTVFFTLFITGFVLSVSSESNILTILEPSAKERAEAAGVFKLPDVVSRQISLSAEQSKYYSAKYKNFKFEDDSRYARGIPLGITGIYAMDSVKRNDLYVYFLHDKSPAKGLVKELDIIVGVNGRLFKDFRDCRVIFGLSIIESQSSDGKLYFHLIRGGNFQTAIVNIGKESPYSNDFPFNCPRSRKIADAQIELIKGMYEPSTKIGEDWWNVLMLMASDDPEAQLIARRAVYELKKPEIKRLASWYLGYELIILSEYYLLTGDSTIFRSIKEYARILENGQCPSGSWGHGLGYGGYGEVNATGLTCFMGLVLAKKCGVKVDEEKFNRSYEFFKKFRGFKIPYGDNPHKQYEEGNNGKGGMAAVIYNILGDKETSEMFAGPSCYSFNFRESGHAEGIFNFAWGPLGAIFASKDEYRLFMNNQLWYYELGRRMDGAYDYLRSGRFSKRQQIGGMGLFLMMPGKKLQILGADTSIFSITPPAGAVKAAKYYNEKKWKEFVEESKKVSSEDAGEYVKKLNESFTETRKVADLAFKSIKMCIANKDYMGADKDLISLEGQLGANWPGIKELRATVEKGLVSEKIDSKVMKKRIWGKGPFQAPKMPKGYKSSRNARGVVLNGWKPKSEIIAEEISENMKKMSIEDVIRHTNHPHETFSNAAYNLLLERKKESRPLIEKLLKHKNPLYRASAIRMLGAFEADTIKPRKWNKSVRKEMEDKKISRELSLSIDLVKALINDDDADVQIAIVHFINAAIVSDDRITGMLMELSKSNHPKVITDMLPGLPYLVENQDTLLKILVSALNKSQNLASGDIGTITKTIVNQKNFNHTPYLEGIIRHLSKDILLRKGIGPYESYGQYVKLFQKYSNDDIIKNNLKLICKFYTRKHLANIEIRKLFSTMDKKLVTGIIKEFIAEEKKWLDQIIKNDPQAFHDSYAKEEYSQACIDELKHISEQLEKGKGIDESQYDLWAEKYKYMNMILIVAKNKGLGKSEIKEKMKRVKESKNK